MNNLPTCFVLGETGVGKSNFINAITHSNECKVSNGPESCTRNCKLVKTVLGNETFQFVDTPALSDVNNQKAIFEIKNEVSKYSNIKFLFILLDFQSRISRGLIEAIKTYMKIFPFYDFWNHVIIIFTKSYEDRGNGKDKILATLNETMKYNGMDLPSHIPIFFVDLRKNREENWRKELGVIESILKNGFK